MESVVGEHLQEEHEGTLTLMTAAENEVHDDYKPILESISKNMLHVGINIGDGQTVKAT